MEISNDQSPQLLVQVASNSGFDSNITIRGARSSSVVSQQGQLTIENYDNNHSGGITHKLVEIAGMVTDHSNNVGGMVISNYSDGTTRAGALTMSSSGNFSIGGDDFQDVFKLGVSGSASISTNLAVGGNSGDTQYNFGDTESSYSDKKIV